MGRQILDASLIANEVIDSWQKRKEKGLICKLDIEKAYDSINWQFLLKTLHKMGFGSKWASSRDPLSPYLFVLGMEVLDALIRRAVAGGYLSASGLRINLDKSEIIPVGVVEEIEEMAVELGCRVGSLPSQYLGLPLGAPNKAPSVWDGVEEKVRRRLTRWKRQYISKGGRITLIRSTLASMPIYHMSLFQMPKARLKEASALEQSLLGKWIWRFAYDKDNLWKQVIMAKYGQEGHGWRAKRAYGAFGVGVWKEILKETEWCCDNMGFIVGKGSKINFWTDVWCNGTRLSQNFPHLFAMASHRNATVEELWDQNFGQRGWNLRFLRDFNDWEMDMIGDLLHALEGLQALYGGRFNLLEGRKEWKV
ncbi:hypothetical protein CK203_094655 [Vitis vinifera]|uniref:Uncharacterized protein n=1 Tax=Vitis vinifera TaxID=29760 RepID=A0A438CKY2_VITVI|nr:hypothetical protein CK203_094655 [Vitis vinifera]